MKTEDSVKKILSHQFYNTHSFYRDEWEEYNQMMSNALNILVSSIKDGNQELVPLLEDYYVRLFKLYRVKYVRKQNTNTVY